MKILSICVCDSGGCASRSAAGLRAAGHDVIWACYQSSAFGYRRSDLHGPGRDAEITALLNKVDAVHLFDYSLDSWGSVIPGRIPVAISYLGSHFRKNRRQIAHMANKRGMAQTCFSQDLARLGPRWLPLPLWDKSAERERTDEFVVFHAPTNRAIKGTAMIMEAVADLTYVHFQMVEGVPNAECLKRKARASVLIDQPGPQGLGIGCNTMEAWEFGIPVISNAPDDVCALIEKEYGFLPFLRARDAKEIRDAVVLLRDSADAQAEWGERGLSLVRGIHSPASSTARFMEAVGESRAARGIR